MGPTAVRLDADAPRAATLAELARRGANAVLTATERLLFPRVPRRPRRVGVWRTGMIGDTLVALPALEAVRASHPDAELVLFHSPGPDAAPGAAELLDGSPAVDRLVRWTREDLRRDGVRGLLARLRAERVDRLYLLPQDRTTPWLELRLLLALRLAGQRGVRGARVATAHFLPRRLARAHDRAGRWRGVAARLLERVRADGADARPDGTALPVGDDHRACAERIARELAPDGEPLLCLAPGGKLEHKRWPAERFGAVARAWTQRGGRAVVLGGPGDRELAARVEAAAGVELPHLCGRAGLLVGAALLARADALVTNDTGTMHLAAAVGAPFVAVFSGWDRRGAWEPWEPADARPRAVLRGEAPCSPCLAPSCARRTAGVPVCLDLGVETVLARLEACANRAPGAVRTAA